MLGTANQKRKAAASSIWQKEFNRPSPASCRRLAAEKQSMTDPDMIIANALPGLNFNAGESFSLSRQEIVELYINAGNNSIYQSTIEYYIQMVCHHINTQFGRAAANTVPVCIMWGDEYWRSLQNMGNTHAILNADHLGTANFRRVHHVLVPILADALTEQHIEHSWLLDISPLAKTVELFNSEPLARAVRPSPELEVPPGGFITCNDDLAVRAFAVLNAHLGREFKPHEWKVRTGRSPDQGTTYSCGVFTCTNAMHVAFGYPINYQGSNMNNKRLRIASEILNGGFANHSIFASDQEAARNEFYYPLPLLGWTDNEFEEQYPTLYPGFHPIAESVLQRLPAQVRNRRGRYDHIENKRDMRYLCRGRRELSDISVKYGGREFTLDQFKEACEERDEAIRTRKWPLKVS